MSNIIEKAIQLRKVIESLADNLTDADAIENSELFPKWQAGESYAVGTKVQYNGTLYKCLQAHDSQSDWIPVDAASLWAKVLIPNPDVIPEWEQPDSTNPYMKGDKVTYNGKTYESLIDNNVWSPVDYPAGWQEVVE